MYFCSRTNSTSFQAFNIDYLPGNLTTESKTPWKLHYYPKLNVTDRLMDRLINQMGGNITGQFIKIVQLL